VKSPAIVNLRGSLLFSRALHPAFVSWQAAPEMARREGVGESVWGGEMGMMLMDQGYVCEDA